MGCPEMSAISSKFTPHKIPEEECLNQTALVVSRTCKLEFDAQIFKFFNKYWLSDETSLN